jgi:hypothetical protein
MQRSLDAGPMGRRFAHNGTDRSRICQKRSGFAIVRVLTRILPDRAAQIKFDPAI